MNCEKEQDMIEARAGRDVSFLDLYAMDQVSREDLGLIVALARKFRSYETHKFALNKGCSVVHAFFEPSTRTLSSFDLSAKNLSMDTNNVSGSASSVRKGESYLDTAMTLDSYNLKVIVVRSAQAGVPEFLARHVNAAVINAGDGWHEHPTQALLDMLTILDHFGVDDVMTTDLSGKTVSIVGDILHSRVFGSLVRVLKMLGATVRLSGPLTLMPTAVENFGVTVHTHIEEALDGAHVVYALRVQEERGGKGYIPSLREYSKMYGINEKRLSMAMSDAVLMHPGPVQRDIDVHSALVAVDERSRILQQVENGMAVRKSLLWLLASRLDGQTKGVCANDNPFD